MDVSSQLKNAQVEHFTEATKPVTIVPGRVIFATDSLKFYIGDGTKWRLLNPSYVGDVRQSMLSEAQFQSENGNEWILCDGRDVTGSDYASVTGNTVLPDMRGMFVRGKNNGRVDGDENPSGDLALGTYEDADANTIDRFDSRVVPGSPAQGTATVPSDGTFSPERLSGGFDGADIGFKIAKKGNDEESRPKNITMNYFIKINR